MKTKHIFALCILALACCLSQSCLKSQVDYFDQSAAERLQAVLTKTRATLAKPEHGWRVEYFIGNVDQDRGGKNMTFQFGAVEDTVRVMTEELKDSSFTSYYRFTNDDGPVLSFDSFSPILHKYAIPSSSYYEARGGDYEFLIISCTDEEVVLKGKRSGKITKMYPLTEPADDYIERCYQLNKNFYVSSFKGTCGSTAVVGTIDVLNKQFTIAEDIDQYSSQEAKTETVPYILTDKGLKFYEPLEFLGQTYNDVTFTPADTSFVSGSTLNLKGHIPADWLPYEFFEGSYLLTHSDGSFAINLIANEDHETYTVKGMSPKFDLFFSYDIVSGRIGIDAQFVAKVNTEEAYHERLGYVIMVPVSTDGYLGTDDTYGMSAVWNGDKTNPRYTWADKGLAPKFITESYLLRLYDLADGFVRNADGTSMAPQTVAFTVSNNKEVKQITPQAMYKINN